MTRPPSTPGFAQFFPTAPKVKAEAEGRGDRDRAPRPLVNGADSYSDLHTNASTSLKNGFGSSQSRISSDAPHPHHQTRVDVKESPPGDIPGTGDSSSSLASASSSVFSTRPSAASASSRYPTASTTPAAKDSPSHHASTRADMPPAAPRDLAAACISQPALASVPHRVASDSNPIESLPARDPKPSVKGQKCTFDPLLERLRDKSISRSAKPVYEEFGLVRTYNIISTSLGRGSVIACENSWLTFG